MSKVKRRSGTESNSRSSSSSLGNIDNGAATKSGVNSGNKNETSKQHRRRPVVVATFGSNYFYPLTANDGENSSVMPWEDGTTSTSKNEQNSSQLPLSSACSAQSTVVLTSKGVVYQMGTLHGYVMSHWTKVEIPLPLKCVQVAAGRHFCLARMEGGKAVVAWGAGHFGQLGVQRPATAPGLANGPGSSGNAGAAAAAPIALTLQPLLIDRLLPSFTGSTIESIAAGDWHGMALTTSGQVWCWGLNRSLQCGLKHPHNNSNAALSSSSSTTTAPGMLSLPLPIPSLPAMKQIAAGKSHSIALTTDGQVYCWGSSHVGQCGSGVTCKRSVAGLLPGPVQGLPPSLEMIQVDAAGNHCISVSKAGRVFCWGDGQEGQLGVLPSSAASTLNNVNNTHANGGGDDGCEQVQRQLQDFYCNKPRLVADLDFVAVAASQLVPQFKRCSTSSLSSVATSSSAASSVAESLSSVPKITTVYAASTYSAALSSSGHVYCWGNNDVGQLGLEMPPPTLEQNHVEPPLASPMPDPLLLDGTKKDSGSDDSDSETDSDSAAQQATGLRRPSAPRQQRPLHIRTFDSNHNVLLPLRVSALDGIHVTSLVAGPNHLLCFGTARSRRDQCLVGQTLYESQVLLDSRGMNQQPPRPTSLPRVIDSGSGTASLESETQNSHDTSEQPAEQKPSPIDTNKMISDAVDSVQGTTLHAAIVDTPLLDVMTEPSYDDSLVNAKDDATTNQESKHDDALKPVEGLEPIVHDALRYGDCHTTANKQNDESASKLAATPSTNVAMDGDSRASLATDLETTETTATSKRQRRRRGILNCIPQRFLRRWSLKSNKNAANALASPSSGGNA